MTSTARAQVQVVRWDARQALARVDDLVAVYREAFLDHWEPDPDQAARGRRVHVAQHLRRGDATVLAALDGDDRLVGFTYALPGRPGHWWHDTVATALTPAERVRWIGDCLEVVELHVRPDAQGQGTGRALLTGLLAGATAATAVLSALDDPTLPARHLYASAGFQVLRSGFRFAGTDLVYAILGCDLPHR